MQHPRPDPHHLCFTQNRTRKKAFEKIPPANHFFCGSPRPDAGLCHKVQLRLIWMLWVLTLKGKYTNSNTKWKSRELEKKEIILTCRVAEHGVPTQGCWWSSGHRTHREDASLPRPAQNSCCCCWWEKQGLLGNRVQMIGQFQNSDLTQVLISNLLYYFKTMEIFSDLVFYYQAISITYKAMYYKLMSSLESRCDQNWLAIETLFPSLSSQSKSLGE